MPIFKPKTGPVLSLSRFCHFLVAATGVAYCGHLGGYEASALGGFVAIAGGFSWELANRFLDPQGAHPFGDAWDFWAFVAGALTGGVGYLFLSAKPQ
jgi:hypothetical protein